eukprot:14866460-Heterocapsa_arctica.AAC.1
MLGTSAKPHLSTKDGETSTLLAFCTDTVRRYQDQLGAQGEALVALGVELQNIKVVCHESPGRLSVAQADRICAAGVRANMLREPAGVLFTPKWHQLLHLVCDSLWRGNPQSYSTFMDENQNVLLGRLAAGCHRATWHFSVLGNFRAAITVGQTGKRRR